MKFLSVSTAAALLLSSVSAALLISGCANASETATSTPPAEASQKVTTPIVSAAPTLEDIDEDHHEDDGEPRPYDKTRDARADVDDTLYAAKTAGKNAIIVMGANWCHDSRGLAAHFMTPRFETMLSENFEYVYVDMGIRNRNLDIAADFGIDKVEGTPTIIIVDSEGEVLNLDTAKTWRNAASRTEDEIYEEFLSFAPEK